MKISQNFVHELILNCPITFYRITQSVFTTRVAKNTSTLQFAPFLHKKNASEPAFEKLFGCQALLMGLLGCGLTRGRRSVCILPLQRLGDQPHTDGFSRDLDPLKGTIHNRGNGLDIRLKSTLGLAGNFGADTAEVFGFTARGVRVAGGGLTSGEFANAWHNQTPAG